MSVEAGDPPPTLDDGDVMAAVDGSGDLATYVIADLSTDCAWIAMPEVDAPALGEWR